MHLNDLKQITKVKSKWRKNRTVINHSDPQPKGTFESRYLECSIKIKGDRGFMISFTFYMKALFIADVCGRKAFQASKLYGRKYANKQQTSLES